jgi:long-subunit fatty acid transport protein
LALGANAYYMFGSLNNYRSISFNPSTGYTSTTQLNNIEANNFRFRYGLQYFTNLNKKQNITVGLIFEPKKNFKVNCTKINSGVLTDTTTYDMDFDLPMTLGGGIFYTYNNKLSVGLDYTLQNWSDARFYGKTDSLTNRNKIAIGAEYIPNSSGRKYSDHIRYRIGFNVNNAYYKIDNKTQGNNFGVTLGFGLPLPYSKTMVNTAFEYGKIGNSGSLKENYFKFTFNVCVNENWFFKRKL